MEGSKRGMFLDILYGKQRQREGTREKSKSHGVGRRDIS